MASFDAYLQIEGIPGEATESKHKDWIELTSVQHGVTQPISSTKGSAGGGATGRSVHGPFVITKFLDKATPKLFEAVSSGKHFKKVQIDVCRAGGDKVKYYEVKMEEVLISNVTTSGHGGSDELPSESVSFDYGKIEWTYTQQKRADGTGGGNVAAKWSVTEGKV